jgi:hypothetical protein
VGDLVLVPESAPGCREPTRDAVSQRGSGRGVPLGLVAGERPGAGAMDGAVSRVRGTGGVFLVRVHLGTGLNSDTVLRTRRNR